MEITCPDLMGNWGALIRRAAIPCALIQFWFTGNFKGRADSENKKRDDKKTNRL
jgi:hypothetical protein